MRAEFRNRFRVEDLVPYDRVADESLRAVFIGESPHRDEVAPESASERSPFRGVAGREWWAELSRFLKQPIETRPVPPRADLLDVCDELGIAVMNAVQFPIDPKITLHQGEKSSPRAQLGFEKGAGEFGYKAVYKTQANGPVGERIDDLVLRLEALAGSPAQLVCLGNDSRWFVEQAISRIDPNLPILKRPLLTIPHPSSWWRNASYKERAVSTLRSLLGEGAPHASELERADANPDRAGALAHRRRKAAAKPLGAVSEKRRKLA